MTGALQGAVVAALFVRRPANRQAHALLAALIVAFVARLVPYIIGYAGFYDAYPWLSFAPFALTFVYGPLIYLYVVRLTAGRMPSRWWLHLIPAALQAAYYLAIFAQPMAFKNRYDRVVHEPWIDPTETLLTFISLGIYLSAAFGRYRAYTRWLDDATSAALEHRLLWLRTFLALFGVTLVLNACFELVSRFIHPLNYFDRFALYVWYAIVVYYLALEGWRHEHESYPQPAPAPAPLPEPQPVRESVDVRAAANAWRDRVYREGHWRDPELTLGTLATALGMSAAHVSRLVNDGLDQNFNETINRMRVAAVQERLRDPADMRDILALALDAGFSSKASFNRSFKLYAETTPSQYRKIARAELPAPSPHGAAKV